MHFVLAHACGKYSVTSIPGLLNVSFSSAHHSRVLPGMSTRNKTYKRGTFRCCVWLVPHDSRLARNDLHKDGCAEGSKTCLRHAKYYAKCPSRQHFGLCEGQLHDISKDILRFWLSVYVQGQKKGWLHIRLLLSFTAHATAAARRRTAS